MVSNQNHMNIALLDSPDQILFFIHSHLLSSFGNWYVIFENIKKYQTSRHFWKSLYSRMTWCHIGMCLEWRPVTGFRPKSTTPLLSQCSGIGSSTEKPSSSRNWRYQKAWLEPLASAIYSASVVFWATVHCFCEDQLIAPLASRNRYPD